MCRLLAVSVIVLFARSLCSAQSPQTQQQMHTRVQALYDFHPAQLTDARRDKKSAEMDVFWKDVKARPDAMLPLLRVELRDAPAGSFFLTDGSELLISLSKTPADEQLAADALARTDLRDTQPGSYFYAVHGLACDGADATKAALHILDDPKFRVSVPQHAMLLDQSSALMFTLLCMKDDAWAKAAAERFATEKDTNAKLALVSVLSYDQTNGADAVLKEIAADSSQPENVRKAAQGSLDQAQQAVKILLPVKGTIAEIRVRQRLRAVSDEAIDDVQEMTRKIAQLRAKGKG